MAKSFTVKKSEYIHNPELDQLIRIETNRIAVWTHKEFQRLNKTSRKPLIWPISTGGYVIGDRRIVPYFGYWQLQDVNHDVLEVFGNSKNAIIFCLCQSILAIKLASDILDEDNNIMRLKDSIFFYTNSLKRYQQRNKYFEAEMCSARLNDAQVRLNHAYHQLEKSLRSAKYMNSLGKNLS